MEKENEEMKKNINPNVNPNIHNPNANPNVNINPINPKSNNPKKNEEQDDNMLLTKSVISQIEKFSTNDNYIPQKVDKSFKLPVNKNTKEYQKLKEEIISHIEDGIVELEYSNMDHAMEHVEASLYYLRNIKD